MKLGVIELPIRKRRGNQFFYRRVHSWLYSPADRYRVMIAATNDAIVGMTVLRR
jgi:hypothetical protein